ncbi:hypothetical protein [Pseudomonas putida]|uniref:Phage protein n=1 Tax=Pseudomonas putida TaxID=303 RepID=A0A7H5R7B4_PSEPU|nr:hypothetical protein [Pseudomonas putida]KAF0255918.1 hypothetical protein GN299_05430 [Pseudomonas putida]QJQ11322.1 hypothetical protein A3L25_018470 [Pseudomonas putida]
MTKQPDWEAIERAYRAGVLSVREIAAAHEVSHTAINKRAKRDGWDRDLKAKIKAKADALVSKREVSTEVSSKQAETEREIIELNAEVIANIRMAHRGDISRSRRLTNKLLDELEGLTDNRGLFEELGELMRNPDDNGQDKRNDLYNKIIDLPGRTKTMKELAETLKTLVALERQAYDLDAKQGGSEEDTLSKLMDELSKDA